MKTIRAVIFDLGHTLWDYAPREDFRRLNVLRMHEALLSSTGDAPAPVRLDRALGMATERWLAEWSTDHLEQAPSEELVGQALESVGVTPPAGLLEELTEAFFGMDVDLPIIEPDGLAAIAELHESGLRMGCVTNTILLEAGIDRALRTLGMLRYFDAVVVSSAMGYRKPHPSLFERVLRELDVSPGEALFVGDRLVDDVGGAQGVGMRAVLTHQYRQEVLDGSRVRPDAVINRLSELPAVVERLAADG